MEGIYNALRLTVESISIPMGAHGGATLTHSPAGDSKKRILPLDIFHRTKLYGQICFAAKCAQRLPMAAHGGRWCQAIQHAAAM